MKKLVVDRQIVRSNLTELRSRAGNAEICAVLKYDAYGLGLEEMAKLLRENGVRCFAVSELSDAEKLRAAGLVDEEILMLRSVSDRAELEQLLDLGVTCSVGSHDAAVALNGIAKARGTVAAVHLKLDTGAGGYGYLTTELDKILAVYQYMANLAVSGIYTELFAGMLRLRAKGQMEAFRGAVDRIHAAGYETGIMHTCRSRALLLGAAEGLDALCLGSALFRRISGRAGRGLRDAAWAEAAADEVRWVPKGYYIGGYATKRPMKIALFPVGRYNGCFSAPGGRKLFGRRRLTVNIDGQKARVIGTPDLLYTVADVTKLRCAPGSTAIIPTDPIFAMDIGREYIE